MNLLQVTGFRLKVGNLLLVICCWFLSLISLSWLTNEGTATRKASVLGDRGQLWVKLWEKVSQFGRKVHHHYFQFIGSRKVNWWKKVVRGLSVMEISFAIGVLLIMSYHVAEKRKETLASMCDERARLLQDQFKVRLNHIQELSVIVSVFHHGKNPSVIDQKTRARYTDRTSFERPHTSGIAYAVRVLHTEREQFESQQGWTIKTMDNVKPTPVHEDEHNPKYLEPSPVQEEYAPVIFAQDTVAHVVSVDMLSGKEDREKVLRARESGKGVLSAPFKLLKTNRLGVILTFVVYKKDLPPDSTPAERVLETLGYLGGIFDIESLVEKLLQQLASKKSILVNVYDTTNSSSPISMYGSDITSDGRHHVSALNFGDPLRKHEMHCRFKHKQPWPWSAMLTSAGILITVLLMHARLDRVAKVEDDYNEMMKLKKRAEAADVAKSQFVATISHEIRTPMNGVLGMLHMLMDTDLDETQQDCVRTARESGKALVSLINEVLDQTKIESGKITLRAVSFDLKGILDDVLSLFSGKAQDKKVELAAFVSNEVPETLVGDPGRFRQIVTNLVGNAIKFTDRGHIYVSVHLVEEVVGLSHVESYPNCTLSGYPVVDKRKSWTGFEIFNQKGATSSSLQSLPEQINIIVSVEDTGQGIPLEAQTRVFNPFIQVGPSITQTHGGTGIGLSISRYLVDLMKGEIGLTSCPQIGSTFTFTAVFTNGSSSFNDQMDQQVWNNHNSVSSEFRGMNALLVDPNPVRAKVSKYHIQRLGIHLEIVKNLNQEFSSSIDKTVDIIFIEEEVWKKDSSSPSLYSGYLSRINCCGKLPKTLLLSSTTSSTRSSGPTPFVIMKPLRASMLAASLQRVTGDRNGELGMLSLSYLLSGRRILVVDDNPVHLKVAAGALKKYGAEVVHAERGKFAITFLTPPHHFDACFMDIHMPEMDGFEATKRIRDIEHNVNNGIQCGVLSAEAYRNVTNWHVPILAMTADVIQATYEECLKIGMDGYVSKPFEAEQLYLEVSRFFQSVADEIS